jgi:hypothetical protein
MPHDAPAAVIVERHDELRRERALAEEIDAPLAEHTRHAARLRARDVRALAQHAADLARAGGAPRRPRAHEHGAEREARAAERTGPFGLQPAGHDAGRDLGQRQARLRQACAVAGARRVGWTGVERILSAGRRRDEEQDE